MKVFGSACVRWSHSDLEEHLMKGFPVAFISTMRSDGRNFLATQSKRKNLMLLEHPSLFATCNSLIYNVPFSKSKDVFGELALAKKGDILYMLSVLCRNESYLVDKWNTELLRCRTVLVSLYFKKNCRGRKHNICYRVIECCLFLFST